MKCDRPGERAHVNSHSVLLKSLSHELNFVFFFLVSVNDVSMTCTCGSVAQLMLL